MTLTEVFPHTGERADASTAEGQDWLRRRYQWPESGLVRLNMITSLTGSAMATEGTSNSLSNRTDRAILRTIRAGADVILVGANTLRAEGYVFPHDCPVAVVTASGNLGDRPLRGGTQRILITPAQSPAGHPDARERITLPALDGIIAATDILRALQERGWRRVICEGGPRLASALAAANLIDEYCVTVSPMITPSSGPFLDLRATVDTERVGTLVDESGFSYLRLRVRR